MSVIKCPECKSIDTSLHIKKNGYQYFLCNSCQIIFLKLNENYQQFIKKFYAPGYFTGDKRYSAYSDYEKNKNIILKNFASLISDIKVRGKHLDVGCAYGYLMELMQREGFNSYGVEASSHAAVMAAKNFKNKIINSTFEKAKLPTNSFSLITMIDVLEHVSSPTLVLKKAASLLTKQGTLVIWTCDQSSLFARLCKSAWHFYNPPQHLFIFTRKKLESLLKEVGFRIIKMKYKGKWFSLSYLLHLARSIQKNRLADKLFHLVNNSKLGKIPIFLRFNDSILVVAQKK